MSFGLHNTRELSNNLFGSLERIGDSYLQARSQNANTQFSIDQNKRQQRQADFQTLKSLQDIHTPILKELSVSNPKAVENYLDNLKQDPEINGLMKRLGLQDLKAITTKPGKINLIMPVKATSRIIEQMKQSSGVAPNIQKVIF